MGVELGPDGNQEQGRDDGKAHQPRGQVDIRQEAIVGNGKHIDEEDGEEVIVARILGLQ